jgi:PKD domain
MPTYTAPTPTPTYPTPTSTPTPTPTNTTPTPTPTYTTPTPTPNTTLTLTASQTHALPGQPINFTVASDPPTGFTQFQYQFGDAEPPGPAPNGVQHAYSKPGTYYASASTQSADGQSTLTSNEVQLQIAAAPLPELTLDLVTASPVAKGSTVLDASLDPRDADETYRFDWGDGTPADSIGILGRGSHIYANPGSYTVSVIATTSDGNIPGQKEITVAAPTSPPIPILPVAIALLLAGTIAGWAYHHFRAPTGELHTTFGVSHTASNQLSMPTSAPHLALTFKNGVEASDHNIRFL